jgi:hypothetical protein
MPIQPLQPKPKSNKVITIVIDDNEGHAHLEFSGTDSDTPEASGPQNAPQALKPKPKPGAPIKPQMEEEEDLALAAAGPDDLLEPGSPNPPSLNGGIPKAGGFEAQFPDAAMVKSGDQWFLVGMDESEEFPNNPGKNVFVASTGMGVTLSENIEELLEEQGGYEDPDQINAVADLVRQHGCIAVGEDTFGIVTPQQWDSIAILSDDDELPDIDFGFDVPADLLP